MEYREAEIVNGKWNKFLLESQQPTIKLRSLKKYFKYFHVSYSKIHNDKGQVVLNLHVPDMIALDSENHDKEDPSTARISFSLDPIEAANAIDSPDDIFVYGTNTIKGEVPVNRLVNPCNQKLSYQKQNWKEPSNDWLSREYQKVEKISKKEMPERLKCCVPDAHINKEVWATKPTKVYFLGFWKDVVDDDFVYCDSVALRNITLAKEGKI